MTQPQIKRKIVKVYDLDEVGNSRIKRTWILENLTNRVLDLPLFFVIEQTDQILNVQASAPFQRNVVNAFTEITLTPKPKLNPQERYEFSVEYDLQNLAHRFSDSYFVIEEFSKRKDVEEAVFHDDDEFTIEFRLPVLKKWWAFWESFENVALPDAKRRKEKRRIVLSWQFVLRPNTLYRTRILYRLKKKAKLIGFLSSIGTLIVTLVLRETIPKIIQTIF